MTGPILVAGWREAPLYGAGFLGGFYLTIVCALAGIIAVFGLAARLGPKVNHAMLGISALVLFIFGLFQISKALR